jgi:thiamine-phosphate diphosphorylase
VLITERCCRRPWLEVAEEALIGGADCIQLREKELDSGELLRRAGRLVELCHQHGKLCIINDRPDIALLSDADGIHVGQDDLPAIEARKLIGRGKILGVSTHRIEQAKRAVSDGADYIGIGPVFPSATKPRDFVAGLGYVREVAAAIALPAVAIAGITAGNVDQVIEAGIKAVAVTAAVSDCDDPRAAAAKLKQRLSESKDIPTPVGQTFLSAENEAPSSGGAGIPACPSNEVKITRRRLPHWTLDGSTYFVTFRVLHGELTESERQIVLEHIKSGSNKFYLLIAAVIMPDHAHILIQPKVGYDLSRIGKGIKGVSAQLLNVSRGSTGTIWQDESWDRIMRDQNELDEKLAYMFDNPARKGLAEDGWLYPCWYYNEGWKGSPSGVEE